MGGDDFGCGCSLLEFINEERQANLTVKNTFLEFNAGPIVQRRLKTDPGRLQFVSPPPKTQSSSESETNCFQNDSDPLPPVEEDMPKEPASPSSSQSGHRVVWDVDAKKLDSKDCRITHTCKIPEGPCTEFVVWLQPEVQKKRRGCSSFSASKGKGYVHVKCNDVQDMELALSVEVGGDGLPAPGMPPLRIRHNFAHNSVVILPNLWDFKSAVDVNTSKLTLGFEVMPCTTLQTSPPTTADCAPSPTTPYESENEDYPRFTGAWRENCATVTDVSTVAWTNSTTWWIPVELPEGVKATAHNWWIGGESSWSRHEEESGM